MSMRANLQPTRCFFWILLASPRSMTSWRYLKAEDITEEKCMLLFKTNFFYKMFPSQGSTNKKTQLIMMVSNSSINDSFTNEAQETQLKWLNAVQYTMFTTIFVVSVIGNTLVCLVIARTPRMRTTRNFLLVNLAVADLTVAMLCIPFEVVLKLTYPRWPLGPVMCKILWPTMTSVTTCSSATLVAISYDR